MSFGGPSRMWKGGVATLIPCDSPGCGVPGLLYRVGESHIGILDRFEGHPFFYERQSIEVEFEHTTVTALTYLLRDDIPLHPPAPTYLAAIVAAYNAHGWNTNSLPT